MSVAERDMAIALERSGAPPQVMDGDLSDSQCPGWPL